MKVKVYNDSNVKNFVSSDWHLGHRKDFIWAKRGYSSVEEHDQSVIAKVNELVGVNDNLFYLGDFCLNTNEKQLESYLNQITCQNIHLIWGNHPNPIYKMYRQAVAEQFHRDDIEVYPFRFKNLNILGYHYECVIQGKYVVFNHFPISIWENMKDGAYMLCGHSHYSYPDTRIDSQNGLTLDCGWDGHTRPLLFEEVISMMKRKNIRQEDHHVKNM